MSYAVAASGSPRLPNINGKLQGVSLGSWKQRARIAERRSARSVDEVGAEEKKDEKELFDFNAAFQDAILNSMDREIGRYERDLLDKDVQIADVKHTKEDLAIALHEEKIRTKSLNTAVETSKKMLVQNESELKITKLERDGLQNSLAVARKAEDEARQLHRRVAEELNVLKKELAATQMLTSAYDADIRVRTNVEERLENDITGLEERKKSLEEANLKLKKEMNKSTTEKQQTEEKLMFAEKMLEVKKLEVQTLHTDYLEATKSKDVLLKQWKNALTSLEKKDRLIAEASAKHENLSSDLYMKQIEIKTLENHGDGLKHQLEEAQERNQQFLQTLKDTEDKLAMEEHASVRVKKQLETIKKGEKQALSALSEEGGMKMVIQKLKSSSMEQSKHLQQAKTDIRESEKKVKEILVEKSEMEAQYSNFTAQVEEKMNVKVKGALDHVKELENEKQRLATKNEKLELSLTQLASEYGALGIANDRLKADFEKLLKDSDALKREVPLQQLRADRAEEELVTHTKGENGLGMELRATALKCRRLEEELETSKKKTREITVAWLDAQQQSLKKDTRLIVEKSSLFNEQTRAKVVDMQYQRAITEKNKLETKMLKALSFTDSLRAKNSTSDKKLSQLKLKIIKLEQQVGHLRLELKARNKEVSELKNSSSQNRSHGDSRLNHQLQKELYESERCRDVDNRIATAAKAQLHDMRRELREAQEKLLNFQLEIGRTRRQEKSTAKGLVAMAKSWEAAFHRRRSKRQRKILKKKALLAERRQERRQSRMTKNPSSENSSRFGGANGNQAGDAHDDALMNPASAGDEFDLGKEMANLGGSAKYKKLVLRLNHVMNVAAERLREVVETRQELRQSVSEKTELATELHRQRQYLTRLKKNDGDARIEQVKVMNRLVRAESLAASMEIQLKSLIAEFGKGNPIDYSYKPDIESSDRLREALSQSLILAADEIANNFGENDFQGIMVTSPLRVATRQLQNAKGGKRPSHRGHHLRDDGNKSQIVRAPRKVTNTTRKAIAPIKISNVYV
jgi:hypothetical protein